VIKIIFSLTCLCEQSTVDQEAISEIKCLLTRSHDLFIEINELLADNTDNICLPVCYINTDGTTDYQIVKQCGLKNMSIKLLKARGGFVKKVSGMIARHAWMVATEIPSAVTAGALSVFAKSNWDPKEPISDKKRLPILFIHGLKHNQSGWYAGYEFLQWYDKSNHVCGSLYYISYDCVISNSWDKAIDDYVEKIAEKIVQIRRDTGHNNVILIGHSLGGIIASRYAETHNVVKHVITIGSPFKGSHVASFLKLQKEKLGMEQRIIDNELVEGSASLEKIRNDAEKSDWEGKIKYYNIRSTTDKLVSKSSTLVTKDPRRVFTLESTGHIGLLFMPNCWTKIYEWLTEIYENLFKEIN
jgi:triacylglycerol esterase/lipase EstA (alpha/beta hydrolase family)